MRAVKATELLVTTDNKVGVLAVVAGIVSAASINIRAISAWVHGNQAYFRLITSDNTKTKQILMQNDYTSQEKEVVIVELPDTVGQLTQVTSKLQESGIDLTYLYGTTADPGSNAIVVFSSKDNEKALSLLSA